MRVRRRGRTVWSSSLLQRLDTVCRYLLVNVLWTVSVLLIITAPGGTHAMLETVRRWSVGDNEPVVRTFIGALRARLIPAGLQTLPLALTGILLIINFAIVGLMGDQRGVLFTALLAVAFPFALFAVTLQPAIIGRDEGSVRDAYRTTVRDIVQAPFAAIVVLLLVAICALFIYIQPVAVLIVPATTARLVLAVRAHLIHQTKERTT